MSNVSHMIEGIFESQAGKGAMKSRKALLVRCRFQDGTGRDACREMLIHAPGNSVIVCVRDEYRDDFQGWEVVSNHDSCWRMDGVRRWIPNESDELWLEPASSPMRADRVSICDGVHVITLTLEEQEELLKISA